MWGVLGLVVGCVAVYWIYQWVAEHWRYGKAARRRQILMRLTALAIFWLAVPSASAALAASIGSENSGYFTGVILFFVGWAPVIALANHNAFETEERRVEETGSYKMNPARAAWIDLGTRQHVRISWNARRGRRHPDPEVAAVADAYAAFVISSHRLWHRRLAKRIQLLDGSPSTAVSQGQPAET